MEKIEIYSNYKGVDLICTVTDFKVYDGDDVDIREAYVDFDGVPDEDTEEMILEMYSDKNFDFFLEVYEADKDHFDEILLSAYTQNENDFQEYLSEGTEYYGEER